MSKNRFDAIAAALVSALLIPAGCSESPGCADNSPAAPVHETAKPVARTEKEVAAAKPAKIALEVVDLDGYNAVIRKHRGRVVLVDCWATWCLPCMAAFPHTVEWSHKYSDQGLRVVSVSIDDKDNRGAALEFLKKKNATFDNLVSEHGSAEKSFEIFDLGGGGVPHYKIYGRTGKLITAFSNDDPDNPFDHTDVEAAVRKALGLPAATE